MTPAEKAREAALKKADWQQVAMNGGPPCFHIDQRDGRFCLRAERWDGHRPPVVIHKFVGLENLIIEAVAQEREECAKVVAKRYLDDMKLMNTRRLIAAVENASKKWDGNHPCELVDSLLSVFDIYGEQKAHAIRSRTHKPAEGKKGASEIGFGGYCVTCDVYGPKDPKCQHPSHKKSTEPGGRK